MKIIFSATGESWDDKLDPRFGRSQGFFLFDEESGKTGWISNEQNANAAHGAGIQAAETVVKTGSNVLITGHVGPKAFNTLKNTKIKIYLSEEKPLKDIYEEFKKGNLQEQTA